MMFHMYSADAAEGAGVLVGNCVASKNGRRRAGMSLVRKIWKVSVLTADEVEYRRKRGETGETYLTVGLI